MKRTTTLLLAGLFMAGAAGASAKKPEAPTDYAETAAPVTPSGQATLKINPAEINVVAGNLGRFGSDFGQMNRNHMNLWLEPKGTGPGSIEWTLQAPAAGVYEVSAVVLGHGSRLAVSCNGEKQAARAEGKGWERVKLGKLPLEAGENTLRLDVDATKGFLFDALEFVQPAVQTARLQEALAMRQQPDWFKDAGYGLMFQWMNRATPPDGHVKPWEQKVNDFDLKAFVNLVEQSGVAYVLWSVTWGEQYISAPIASLDHLIKGRTTRRDLLGEMADALQAKGIKLIFYYHYGYDCNHSIDADWMKASGGYQADKTEFYQNWMAIISEIGRRYGDKLNGWWFDGGQRYYNCHFDGTPGNQGMLSAPFKELTQAARSGNAARIVAYNSWIKPRLTEYQDFYAGEGAKGFAGLHEGVFASGPQAGLMGHGCFFLRVNGGTLSRIPSFRNPGSLWRG